jgi:hypothetical protein
MFYTVVDSLTHHYSHSDALLLVLALLSQWRSCVEPESGDKVEQSVFVSMVGLRMYYEQHYIRF